MPRAASRFVSCAKGGWLDGTYKPAARVPGVEQYEPLGALGGQGGARFDAESPKGPS